MQQSGLVSFPPATTKKRVQEGEPEKYSSEDHSESLGSKDSERSEDGEWTSSSSEADFIVEDGEVPFKVKIRQMRQRVHLVVSALKKKRKAK